VDSSRWNYIKNLAPDAGRYIHVSCEARMEKDENGQWAPFITPGVSAKNLYKRARRLFFKQHGRRQALKIIKRTVRENTL
jgi:hypothetical protein